MDEAGRSVLRLLLASPDGVLRRPRPAGTPRPARARRAAALCERRVRPRTPLVHHPREDPRAEPREHLPKQPNPLARDEKRATGYIDVAFEITKYGQSRTVEIVEEANASTAAKRDLLALIRNNRFRPRLTNGHAADATPVRVRYYLY